MAAFGRHHHPRRLPQDRKQRTERNERQPVGITPTPAQFRHVVKVHTVHTGDQCGRDTDHGDDRKHSEYLVLLGIDEPQNGIQKKLGLAGQMCFEIDQRDNVLLCRAQSRFLIRQEPVRRHLQNEPDDSLQAEHALANPRKMISRNPNLAEALA
jgi:hypothetical protein